MIWDETQTFTQRSPGWTDTSHCALGSALSSPVHVLQASEAPCLLVWKVILRIQIFCIVQPWTRFDSATYNIPSCYRAIWGRNTSDLTPLFPGRDKPTFVWLGTVTTSQERSCSPSEWLHGRDELPATARPPPCWASNAVLCPFPKGIGSKPPSGYLKLQIVPNPTNTMFFSIHTYLW